MVRKVVLAINKVSRISRISHASAASVALACLSGTSLAQQQALDPLPKPLPQAFTSKGQRPKSNPNVLPPASIKLNDSLQRLAAPANLALPTKPEQVRISSMRPLSLKEVENLAEVNNPTLKSIASQVDQAESGLRVQLAAWYPTVGISLNGFPSFTGGQQMANDVNPATAVSGEVKTGTSRWSMTSSLSAQWSVVNPQRAPQVSAARDQFEKAKNQYIIALRDLRLQAAQAYFDLQVSDEKVRIGQQSVGASLISLRDARARFKAGVATRLEVLQAETQLGRDQQLLSDSFAEQSVARRDLARLLNLPQDTTPTSKEPLRVIGLWRPSLQESIIASYTFREELDNIILDISASNSQANSALGSVQPFMTIVNNLLATRYTGPEAVIVDLSGTAGYAVENSIGLNFTWNLFDGGAARAQYRQFKQKALENEFNFSKRRDELRLEVERSFYFLGNANRNIVTTAKEVLTSREGLRLARLRFQAGVTTQREVVEQQRDLTQAEIRYANALGGYNRNLAELRRRTGLDLIAECRGFQLPAIKPAAVDTETIPVPPSPTPVACPAALTNVSAVRTGPAI
jgi:OMF family outer membrane factor